MALRINYNLASSSAQRGLASSQDAYAKQAQRLSTGLRINSASDDAAGMTVSEKLKNQVRGLNQAQRNAQDGVSLTQTAEGALIETHSILARIGNATQFNGTSLLNGSTASITLQIGANNGDTLAVPLTDNTAATPAVAMNNITTQATASAAITAIDDANTTVSTNRSNLGAMENRLDSVTRSLAVASENTAPANSRIADADIASSMSELVRSQILQQAGVSVLAQENQAPSMVPQLLK